MKTLPPKSLLVNDAFRIELQTATATGDLITEDGQAYVGQEYYNPGSFTVGETITGSDSGATGTVLVNSTTTEVFFTPLSSVTRHVTVTCAFPSAIFNVLVDEVTEETAGAVESSDACTENNKTFKMIITLSAIAN